MATAAATNATELLLMRQGLLFVDPAAPGTAPASAHVLRGFELEVAALGFVVSYRLRRRLAAAAPRTLQRLLDTLREASRKLTGGHTALEPLFRRFPDGVPDDTETLWWERVISLFLQAPEQPCVHCRASGHTHVLDPCGHVVCDRCFDGRNYSGCPICGGKVRRDSPFFKPSPPRAAPAQVPAHRFTLLDVGDPTPGDSLATAAAHLLAQLAARTQVMAPTDVDALQLLIREFSDRAIGWIPATIPVRENVALIFAALLEGALGAWAGPTVDAVMAAARPHLRTATDVLRLIAALSGQSPGLLPTPVTVPGPPVGARYAGHRGPLDPRRFPPPADLSGQPPRTHLTMTHKRFKVRKLPRRLRRELLTILDQLPTAARCEDMWRHRARWVWVGQFLHPGEFSTRLPGVAATFAWLRNPEHVPAPVPRWHTRVEAALARDSAEATRLLAQRPGEWLRRLDVLLRRSAAPDATLAAFLPSLPHTPTPALLTLRAHLARRGSPLPARVYFPKRTFWVPRKPHDHRPVLPPEVIERATSAIDEALLARFATLPSRAVAVLDEALATVVVPFSERNASRGAVALPRGSTIALDTPAPGAPPATIRFFMHWCEPPGPSNPTDLDLSVGFFDDAWAHVGTCAYYALKALDRQGRSIASSSGDFTSAPWPDGAAEFVDLDRAAALDAGYRYALMVVNAYSGLPFSALARATAGVMQREGARGAAFDPRTVEHAFALTGNNGVFVPMLIDLATSRLHWLDAYAKGLPALNNVATSARSLQQVASAMLSYFGSGTRPSMFDLVRYHAAARCARVLVRPARADWRGTDGPAPIREYVRRAGEPVAAFWRRLGSDAAGDVDRACAVPDPGTAPALVALLHGDLTPPPGSDVYALLRRQVIPTISAADLLA